MGKGIFDEFPAIGGGVEVDDEGTHAQVLYFPRKMSECRCLAGGNAPKFTGPRSIRGKARYVAPEQVHGEPASVLSDIYSAGCDNALQHQSLAFTVR